MQNEQLLREVGLNTYEAAAYLSLLKGLDIRVVQNSSSCFGVVDDSIVVLFQLYPADSDRVLSVVKIRDAGFAKNLKEEFELLWNAGEKLDLQKELEDAKNPGKN